MENSDSKIYSDRKLKIFETLPLLRIPRNPHSVNYMKIRFENVRLNYATYDDIAICCKCPTGVGVFWKEISRFTFRQCMHTNVRFFNSESGVATSFTPPCAMGSFADVPQGRTRTQCVFGRSYWRTISASREQVRQRVWICRRAGPVLIGLAATEVAEWTPLQAGQFPLRDNVH